MLLPLFAIFCCVAVAYLILFRGGTDARLMQTGHDIAIASMEKVGEMEKVIGDLSALEYKHSLVIHLHMMLVAQMTYIHDVVGLIATIGLKDPQQMLGVLHRMAMAPEFDFNAYAIKIAQSLNRQIATHDISDDLRKKLDQIKENLNDAANVIMPVRNILAREFKKSGVGWTSQESKNTSLQ